MFYARLFIPADYNMLNFFQNSWKGAVEDSNPFQEKIIILELLVNNKINSKNEILNPKQISQPRAGPSWTEKYKIQIIKQFLSFKI